MPKEAKAGVTAAQTDVLCTFFEENPEVIKGYKKTPQGIDAVQSKWKRITPQLNSLGTSRDHKSWAKYLCNVKAKLKRKRIKWRQNSDGTGPIMCNADDFSEIELRMLQILRKNIQDKQESQEHITSDVDMRASIKEDDNIENDNSSDVNFSWQATDDDKSVKQAYIKLMESDSLALESQIPPVDINHSDYDEFDTFGKNIAQQLRTLPLAIALETQEMLLSVMRKQRLKMLSGNYGSNKNVINAK